MNELHNDRYLRALMRQPVDVTPIWIMRQAGRYLPEYQLIRKKAGDFMSLCKNPQLASEVTLQPLKRYPLDAAIVFSDILTIPDAMGLSLHFIENEGPRFEYSIRSKYDIDQLPIPDPEQELKYVMDTIRTVQKNLRATVPLIGFAGSPWTLATYMVEGGSTKSFMKIKRMLYSEPALLHGLLEKLTTAIVLYLNAQIKAGVQAIMLFDTWGGVLTTNNYQLFSLQYMRKIIEQVIRTHNGRTVPITLFTKDGGQWLELIAGTGCDAIGLDWKEDLAQARQRVGDKVALQGNMDPAALYAPPAKIKEEITAILAKFGKGSGHVFNLGHGIHQDIDPNHVDLLVKSVHSLSAQYHATK